MLTLQFINENPEHVIERLAVKNFDAREPIMKVVELDKQRRAAQKERDDNASQLNKMAAQIGALMKQGKRDEAEQAKAAVAALKATNKDIDDRMSAAANEITEILLSIPNVPYEGVPAGLTAEDNVVEKTGGPEPHLADDALPTGNLPRSIISSTLT